LKYCLAKMVHTHGRPRRAAIISPGILNMLRLLKPRVMRGLASSELSRKRRERLRRWRLCRSGCYFRKRKGGESTTQ